MSNAPSVKPAPYSRKVIIGHQSTEKASVLLAANQYVFKIHKLSNKLAVKKAVEKEFSVKVQSVNVLNRKGKTTRRGKTAGKKSDWKKAYVTLMQGFSINSDVTTKKD